ncbi:MAG: hypothetical protein NWE89_09350 [Candidatus Bathyarchaeota archaeon]|nr:hypothetical protein [Candidatus Bathyarchaeota archaeon]
MSQLMLEAKEAMEKILTHIGEGSHPDKETLTARLQNSVKIVAQNQNKIWLRTKKGKPMAEALQAAAMNMLEQFEGEASLSEISSTMDELESQVKMISEESRKRSMVVT